MELSQEIIEQWCEKNYPGCKILELDMRGNEDFSLLLRCWHANLPFDRFCKIFIDRFSLFTLTNWTVMTVKRMFNRKDYNCSLSGRNKRLVCLSKRNKDCRAKIEMRRKKMTRRTLNTDLLLREELCIEIKVTFQHSHSIRTRESYNLLRCTARTKERFLEYFSMGVGIQDATYLNEMYIRLAHYGSEEREIQLTNGMINPNPQKILHLHYDSKKEKQATASEFDSMERIIKEKAIFESRGFHIRTLQNPKIIVVLTPLTKMVFEEHGDEIFVDSSGVAGKDYEYVTSIFVPTKIGALPIGYIVHSGQKEHEYEEGFKFLSATLNEFCGKYLKPKVVTTNDGEQLDELMRFFPTSTVDVCPYANVILFWTFICDVTNEINEDDRSKLVEAYVAMIETTDKRTFENLLKAIAEDVCIGENLALLEVMNKLWYTKDWSTKDVASTKLTANHIRIYRELVVRKFQKFNAYVVIKLLTDILEGMYMRYIHQLQYNSIYDRNYPLFAVFYEKTEKYNILPVRPGEYLVQSLSELDQICTVFEELKLCTCTDGKLGAYCTHLCAVEYEFGSNHNISVKETLAKLKFPKVQDEIQKIQQSIHKLDDDEISFLRDENTKRNTCNTIHSKESVDTDVRYEFVSEREMSIDDDLNNLQVDEKQFLEEMLLHDHNYYKCTQGNKIFIEKANAKEIKTKTQKQSMHAKTTPDEETEHKSGESSSQERCRQLNEEEAETIGKGWTLLYKSLTPVQKILAKKAIDKILFEATLSKLHRNSVSINVSNLDPIKIEFKNEQ